MDDKKLKITESIFEKTIGQKRSWKAFLIIGLGLFLTTLVVGYIEFGIVELFAGGHWRELFVNPSVIFYILLVAPILTEMENKVIEEIIKLGDLTEEVIHKIHDETQAVNPPREWLSVGVGVLIVLIMFGGNASFDLISIYLLLIAVISFGMLSWTVYSSIVSIRITERLLKQPLKVDLFDLDAFKVVGKSSLYLALAFIGGFTLAIIFTAQNLLVFQELTFWIINMPMFFLPVIIFFWNMYPTFKIIDSEKKAALKKVGQQIRKIKESMLEENNPPPDIASLSKSLRGYIILEERIEKIQTWPYEVSTLRSLFGSILIPVVTVVGQVFLRRLLGW